MGKGVLRISEMSLPRCLISSLNQQVPQWEGAVAVDSRLVSLQNINLAYLRNNFCYFFLGYIIHRASKHL